MIQILIVALSNVALRGGAIKWAFPRFRHGKVINALVCGSCVYSVHPDFLLALEIVIATMIAQAPGIFHPDTDRAKAVDDWCTWSLVVFERGALWALPYFIIFQLYFHNGWLFLFLLLAMPVCYSSDWWFRFDWKFINRWTFAEFTFGLAIGILLWMASNQYFPKYLF